MRANALNSPTAVCHRRPRGATTQAAANTRSARTSGLFELRDEIRSWPIATMKPPVIEMIQPHNRASPEAISRVRHRRERARSPVDPYPGMRHSTARRVVYSVCSHQLASTSVVKTRTFNPVRVPRFAYTRSAFSKSGPFATIATGPLGP